jgi:outer membrane receptor protein involved in Fe transport
VTNYELDWDRRIPMIDAVARTAVFYQISDSLQTVTSSVLVPLPNGSLLNFPGNVGNSEEFGVELSAKGTISGGWHWSIGYSPRLVRDHFLPDEPTLQTSVDFARTTPQHVVDVSGGWSNGKWEIDIAGRFQSSFDGLVPTPETLFVVDRIHSYLTVDARVAYRIMPNLTASVVGRGITMNTQQQTSIGTVDRQVFAMIQASF